MDPQLQSLRFWHDLILTYALLLGIEAPVLQFVGTLLDRPRIERVLALLPALAFGWGAWSAKLINDQQVNAASALQWGYAHYPTFPVAVDAAAAVDSATRTGWAFGVAATLLLIGGWCLVLLWSRSRGPLDWASVVRSRRRHDIRRSDTAPPRPAPLTDGLDEPADEGLEITVERMDP